MTYFVLKEVVFVTIHLSSFLSLTFFLTFIRTVFAERSLAYGDGLFLISSFATWVAACTSEKTDG
jgi:hypothetical protein